LTFQAENSEWNIAHDVLRRDLASSEVDEYSPALVEQIWPGRGEFEYHALLAEAPNSTLESLLSCCKAVVA